MEGAGGALFTGSRALLAGAFFLSGASALIYELLWFRLLGHIFGSTATATSTLLAAYLFGLGFGAWLFGRLSDRAGRSLRITVYVAMEAGIGLYGIASHALLERGASLYALAYHWASDSPGALLFARFLVSFVLVAIPTTLMGGTFPLMVHLARAGRAERRGSRDSSVHDPSGVGRATGRAYAVNTAGAALGTLALPSILLPSLGVAGSLAIAAASNLGAAGLAFLSARRAPGDERKKVLGPAAGSRPGAGLAAAPDAAEGEDARSASQPSGTGAVEVALLAAFFLSSFASLALEAAWTRHLGFHFGTQIQTFAFVLFAYLFGLFLGGASYARWIARGRSAGVLLRLSLLLVAVGVAIPVPFLNMIALPHVMLTILLGSKHASYLAASGLLTMGLILVPALGFGMALPAVVQILSRRRGRTGASVGLAYAVNTAGTTLGSMAAGFVLIPALGTQRTFEVCILLVAAALGLAWTLPGDPAGRRPILRFVVPAAFLVVLLLPRWDWRLAHAQYSNGPPLFIERYRRDQIWPLVSPYKFLFLKEGTEATVSVVDFGGGERALYINGKPDASNIRTDMVAQRLLGLIPVLFHPDPRRALIIGIGSGTTVGTLARSPLESIEAAEISPEVSEAARRHFRDINDGFLENPRVSLRLDDGRNYLHFRPSETYDLIINEPSNPWMSGVSGLFTDEFFDEARDRLRPGGIICQWFHYYNMSLDHIRLLTRTFCHRFPEAALFVVRGQGSPTGDMILVGSKGPLRLSRFPDDPALPAGVKEALAQVDNGRTSQMLSELVVGPTDMERFVGTGPLNTDDRPILELEAPADRFGTSVFDNLVTLITATERTFLAAGPLPEEAPAAAEIAKEGLRVTGSLSGIEARRGVLVLTRPTEGGDDVLRWVLLGRQFQEQKVLTGVYHLARLASSLAELGQVTQALAGPGALGRGETTVNGHAARWVFAQSGDRQVVTLGWTCPAQARTFFLVKRAPIGSIQDPAASAREEAAATVSQLAAQFSCVHPDGVRAPAGIP